MLETELKLAVHGSFSLPAFFGEGGVVDVRESEPLHLRAAYHDTSDLRLARNGITLRYRSGEEGGPKWTLKLPVESGKLTAREEIEAPGDPENIPQRLRELIIAFVRNEEPIPIATLATRRRNAVLIGASGEVLAEVSDDEVSVLDGVRVSARFREIEVEKKEASDNAFEEICSVLFRAGASQSEPLPKVVRALGPRAMAPSDVPERVDVGPKDPAADVIRACLIHSARRLIWNDPVARIGHDPEGVHQMRVATRRLRSDLKTFAPMIDEEWRKSFRAEAKWLADLLGEVRDLDVMLERLHAGSDDIGEELKPMFDLLNERHEEARAQLLSAMTSQRYLDFLDRVVDAPRAIALTKASERSARQLVSIVRTLWNKLDRDAGKLRRSSSDERWHKVRIRAKQARYAAEAVAYGLGPRQQKANRFAKRVATVQDVLGEHQDSVVARDLIAEVAFSRSEDGSFNRAAGRLIERQTQAGTSARATFRDAWGKLDRKKNLAWLKS